MPKMTKDQLAQQKLADEREAKKIANRVVEKARRAIKPPAKDEIAQGWWVGLKADVASALVAFKG